MEALYAHVRFDDLDTRSQWVGKGKKSALHVLSATKQTISIKLAYSSRPFLHDLDLANFYRACPTCLFSMGLLNYEL